MAKIVAKTEKGLLVEMREEEIAMVLGPGYTNLFYGNTSNRPKSSEVFKVGVEVPIGDIWNRLDRLSQIQRTLDGVAAEMRKAADWLDTVPAILEPPSKKSAKKDNGS